MGFSSNCSCPSLEHSTFDVCKKNMKDVPPHIAKVLIFVSYHASSADATFISKANALKQSGVKIVCINIAGSDLSLVASPGYYSYFPSAESFQMAANACNLNLPIDKPEVTRDVIGSTYIRVANNTSKPESVTEYVTEIMGPESTAWYAYPATQNSVITLKSRQGFTISQNTVYNIRSKVKSKTNLWSSYSDVISLKTIKQNVVYKGFCQNLPAKLLEIRNYLNGTMIEEGKIINTKLFNALVFGYMGVGKSSFLCTVDTAWHDKDEFQHYFTIGYNNEKTTTKTIAKSKICPLMNGIDVPGALSNIYDLGKFKLLVEGSLKPGTNLDSPNWTQGIIPFDISRMVHVVFFIVPIEACNDNSLCTAFRDLYAMFKQYSGYGIDGYEPIIIMTKGDTLEDAFQTDKSMVFDSDVVTLMVEAFCSKAKIPTSAVLLGCNYTSVQAFEKDDLINFNALHIIKQATAYAKGTVKRLANYAADHPVECGIQIQPVFVNPPAAPAAPAPPAQPMVPNHFTTWTNDHVLTWLQNLNMPPATVELFRAAEVSGVDLSNMTHDSLGLIGLRNFAVKNAIWQAIQLLRNQ